MLPALEPLGRRGGLLPHGPRGLRGGDGGGGTAQDGGGGGQVGVLLQPLQEHVEHGYLAEGPPLAMRGLEGRRRHRADVVVVGVLLRLLPPGVLADPRLLPVCRLLVELKGGARLKMSVQQ